MAERNRSQAREAALSCQAAWLRRRQALEDAPMSRVSGQAGAVCEGPCSCPCACQVGELQALLEEQNCLLCDILGAVTSLTAAQLAASQAKGD